MPPETAKLLRDIQDAANYIRQFVTDKSRNDYLCDVALRHAVQWNFAIIGEALSQLHKHDAAAAEQIHEWRRIIAFRNQLIHGYGVIQNEITWDIIETKLPTLLNDLKQLLPSSP